MSQPVFLLIIAKGYTEAWHQLSAEEQKNLWSKVMEIHQRNGAKWHFVCDSRWADEEIFHCAVVEYPSLESIQKKVKELETLDWWRYFSARSILGTKIEMQ